MSYKQERNQFYISSGLQVINAIEYIFKFQQENNLNELVVLNTEANSLKEIQGAISIYKGWSKVLILNPRLIFKLKKGKLKVAIHAVWAKFRLNTFFSPDANLIFGHDQTLYSKYISKKGESCKQILLDDGNGSVNYNSRESYVNLSKNFKYLYKYFGVEEYIIKPHIFFTSYFSVLKNNNHGAKLIENDFNYLKSQGVQKVICDKVFFIGDLLIERGRISREEYFQTINNLKSIYGNNLVYVRRLKEDENKLNQIKEIIEVLEPTVPFESFLIMYDFLPKKVFGYHSTVLFNINKIYGDLISLYFIKLKEFSSEQYKQDVENLYEQLIVFAKEYK